jgi:hypothetical protein
VQRWGDKPVREIDSNLVWGVVDEAKRIGIPGIKARNRKKSEARARALFVALSSFFGWLKRERRVEGNPCSNLSRPASAKSRDRVRGARLKSTRTKRAARSASAALKRAINKLDKLSSLVDLQERQFFNSSDPDEAFPRDKVLKLTETLDQAARAPYGKVIQEKAERKRLAAIEARRLLLEFRMDRRITAAKGSRYVRLTALLSGDPKADLSSVCRAHLRKVKSGASKSENLRTKTFLRFHV